jgi:hypothetical protein
MKTTTAHPFAPPKAPYRILEYPSGNLLAVDIEDGEVLMDKDQAITLLRILQLAVPELEKAP